MRSALGWILLPLALLVGCGDNASSGATGDNNGNGSEDDGNSPGRPRADAGQGGGDPDADGPDDDTGEATDGSAGPGPVDGGLDGSTPDGTTDDGGGGAPDGGVEADSGAVEPTDVGLVRGPLLGVDPTSIFFNVDPGTPTSREVVYMRNLGDEPFTIYSVALEAGADPGFRVSTTTADRVMEAGAEVDFAVFYDATGAPEANAEVVIAHSLAGSPFRIPVTAAEKGGTVEPEPTVPPCIRVRPTTLDFGTVPRGAPVPVERTFTIENCGTSEFRVQRLDRGSVLFFPTPANFQWTSDPLPMTLAPGSSRTVRVTFEAGRAGLQTGAIDVRTNISGTSSTVRVNLRATSAPPPDSELDLKLILRWDVDGGSDVDFHFIRTATGGVSCNDCYFANMTPDWGVAGDITDDPFLDFDDLQGPGPENINVDELADGVYRITVHYYSDTGSGGSDIGGSSTPANATVEVYIGGTLRATYGPQRLGRTSDTWDVATLEWPSQTLTPLNRMFTMSASGGCP